ncbi:MAG: CapA family protein [Muribaculaceae bacterium]|nr:CapA family protein [Muribaculaceae bacterium]
MLLHDWILAAAMALFAEPDSATIVFAGDAMQHQKQIDVARTRDGFDYKDCFADITDWVSAADYAVVNLETPLGRSDYSGYPCFNAPVEYAEALRDTGFDMLVTANNHTLDRRDRGLKRTLTFLDSLGVDHIGTYVDKAARSKSLPMIKDINGFKVGFLNYTYGTNGIPVQGNVVVDLIDRDHIRRDIKTARQAGAELVAVIIHWGIEYVLLPPEQVKKLADFLCKEDVDMVIGGHPHVIQPMEVRDNPTTGRPVLLVYSMGNLISNMKTTTTRGGAMVRAVIRRDKNGKARFDKAEYMPHFTIPGTSPRNNFRVVLLGEDTPVDNVIPPSVRPLAKAWLNAVIPVFNRHNKNVPRAK